MRWGTKCQTNVVSVGEMSTVRKAKTHDTVLGLHQRREGREAGSSVQREQHRRIELKNKLRC